MEILELLMVTGQNCLAEELLPQRSALLEMSNAANEAVICPKNAGRLPYQLRNALAARISGQSNAPALKRIYQERLKTYSDADQWMALSDGSDHPTPDAFRDAMVAYSDLVTLAPSTATRKNIVMLQKAGLTDADIVQLAELVACVNYLTRLVPGLNALEIAS